MSDLFTAEWMKRFGDAWNAEPDLGAALAKINFNSTIAYGFAGEAQPRGYLKVENGMVVDSGAYSGQALNWDLRCKAEDWQKWIQSPPGMMGLGMAYTTGKIKFAVGDYGAMVKDPRMAGPFIKSFAVMSRA